MNWNDEHLLGQWLSQSNEWTAQCFKQVLNALFYETKIKVSR